jgi:hypothetical protein
MTESDQPSGSESCGMRRLMGEGDRDRPERRHNGQNRTTGMVLDPLAEIGGGMFMPVIIGLSQDVVYFQGRSKGREND